MTHSRQILAALALATLAAAPFAASAADGLSYTYVQGGYVATNTDGGDADGWGLEGSAALNQDFHVFGTFANQGIDDSNVDFDQWRVGIGYNHQLSQHTDLLTRVAYDKFDAGNGADFDGYSVEAGVRAAMTPMLEGYALAGYEDGEEFDGDFYGRLGAQLKFNQNWGMAADVKVADGDTQWFVGPRLTW
jgi:Ax21 family sulfation-dependent quorum factor